MASKVFWSIWNFSSCASARSAANLSEFYFFVSWSFSLESESWSLLFFFLPEDVFFSSFDGFFCMKSGRASK